MELAIIVVAFLAFTAYREYMLHKMLEDLHRKLAAKNISEYATLKSIDEPVKPEPTPEPSPFEDAFDVDPGVVLTKRSEGVNE